MKKVSGLGKGLSALISERKIDIAEVAESKGKKAELSVDEVFPGRFQPRVIFDPEEMEELSESIRRNGVVQPILVRKRIGQGYEIIAGERRWRASKLAKIKTIPSIILDVDDRQAMEIGLIENVQRQNLKVLEEAEGYKRLISEFEYTQEQLADVMGKSRSHITNLMRLLGLPEKVKEYLNVGDLSAGHARALLTAPDPITIADEVIKKNYSVRQTESLVRKLSAPEHPAMRKKYKRKTKSELISGEFVSTESVSESETPPTTEQNIAKYTEMLIEADEFNKLVAQPSAASKSSIKKEPEIVMMEEQLSQVVGLKVEIDHIDESGEVRIKYSSMEELASIVEKLDN